MPNHNNYYNILGINRSATNDEIKSAYYTLSKKYHPDKNPTGDEEFRKISAAYNTLSDSQWREVYNKFIDYKIEDEYEAKNDDEKLKIYKLLTYMDTILANNDKKQFSKQNVTNGQYNKFNAAKAEFNSSLSTLIDSIVTGRKLTWKNFMEIIIKLFSNTGREILEEQDFKRTLKKEPREYYQTQKYNEEAIENIKPQSELKNNPLTQIEQPNSELNQEEVKIVRKLDQEYKELQQEKNELQNQLKRLQQQIESTSNQAQQEEIVRIDEPESDEDLLAHAVDELKEYVDEGQNAASSTQIIDYYNEKENKEAIKRKELEEKKARKKIQQEALNLIENILTA